MSVFLKGRCFLRSLTAKVSILRSSEAVVSSAPWWIEPKRRNCQWEDLLRFEKKPQQVYSSVIQKQMMQSPEVKKQHD